MLTPVGMIAWWSVTLESSTKRRDSGFELTNGTEQIAAVQKVNGEYDLKTLSELALSLKRDHPDVEDASVLLEPDVEYDDLIQVMDAIRSTEVSRVTDLQPTKVALFKDIAVGDAP